MLAHPAADPIPVEERAASAELLRAADETANTLRAEVRRLDAARTKYRRRLYGSTRDGR